MKNERTPTGARRWPGRRDEGRVVVKWPALRVENHGSVGLLRPLRDEARAWLEGHTGGEAQWFGGALVVEPRYVADIVHGAREAGLEVR